MHGSHGGCENLAEDSRLRQRLIYFALAICLGFGLVLLLSSKYLGSAVPPEWVIACVPIWNIGAIGFTVFRLARVKKGVIYLPMVACLLATTLFHCYGPLVFTFGSTIEKAYASVFFPVDNRALLSVLILSQSCQIGMVLGYIAISTIWGKWMDGVVAKVPYGNYKSNGLFLLLALWGLLVKYFIQIPADLHLVDKTPPGLLLMTGYFSYAAHFYFWHEVAAGRLRKFIPLAILIVDILFGVIMLAKVFMILPIIVMLMGWNLASPIRKRTFFILAGVGLVLFSIVQPVNAYLRMRKIQGTSSNIFDIISDISEVVSTENIAELQDMTRTGEIGTSAHSRLCYVDTMAYAINEWNLGRPWDSYKHFKYLFIPRTLWPAKPLAEIGLDFTRRAMGLETSFTGVTLFGEAYFNLGILGVLGLCIWLPGMLFLLELPSRLVLERNRFEQALPLFLALLVGFQVDGYALLNVSLAITAFVSIPVLLLVSNWFKPQKGLK